MAILNTLPLGGSGTGGTRARSPTCAACTPRPPRFPATCCCVRVPARPPQVSGILAQSKGRSLGIYEEKETSEEEAAARRRRDEAAGVRKVSVFGMSLNAVEVRVLGGRLMQGGCVPRRRGPAAAAAPAGWGAQRRGKRGRSSRRASHPVSRRRWRASAARRQVARPSCPAAWKATSNAPSASSFLRPRRAQV